MLMKTTDRTPDAVKVACPVWSGGKGGDNFKALPITISRVVVFAVHFLLCVVGMFSGGKKFQNGTEADGRGGSRAGGKEVSTDRAYGEAGKGIQAW